MSRTAKRVIGENEPVAREYPGGGGESTPRRGGPLDTGGLTPGGRYAVARDAGDTLAR